MAAKQPSLSRYEQKRNFTKTPEPKPKKRKSDSEALFVMHKHAASHLHYDLRLLINGVLVSWAIPKGPPAKMTDKRLAIRTEDHPREYATFEGVIPEDNYGAGTVMVWDTGIFTNIKDESIATSLEKGRIEIILQGQKLYGPYALIKIKLRKNEQESWLFFRLQQPKMARRKMLVGKEKSATTHRTMAQIRKES